MEKQAAPMTKTEVAAIADAMEKLAANPAIYQYDVNLTTIRHYARILKAGPTLPPLAQTKEE